MKLVVIKEEDYRQLKIAVDKLIEKIGKKCGDKNLSEGWLDGQQVCLLLNISKRTLQYYKLRGLLPYSLIGNKSFYKVRDVQKMINDFNKE